MGDFGFALGIMGVFLVFGSIDYETIFAAAPDKAGESIAFLGYEAHALTVLCILLFIGALGNPRSSVCIPGCLTRWRDRPRSRR